MTQSPREEVDGNLSSLKNRAKKLLVWITRHQNDVDRHGLAAICKEGKQTVLSILKAGDDTDTAEFESSLWEWEARQLACDEEFAEELQGFKNISPDMIDSLDPALQRTVKYRIAKALTNIYKSSDTPESILAVIEDTLNQRNDLRIEDILSLTLDDANTSSLVKSFLDGEELRQYIRDRIGHMSDEALIQQVKTLLKNVENAYVSPSTGYVLPKDTQRFINTYNSLVDQLDSLYDYSYSGQSYWKLSAHEIYLGVVTLEWYQSEIESAFIQYEWKIEEMKKEISDRQRRAGVLLERISNHLRKAKPSHISQYAWEYALERLREIYGELTSGRKLSSALSSYENEVASQISRTS